MSTLVKKPEANRGKWVILIVFMLSCAAILPLSWNAIQAQRAQQKTMKALKKSIVEITSALKTERCAVAAITAADELKNEARNVELVFPRLSQASGDFAKLSRALVRSSDVFSAQAKSADCRTLRAQLPELKKRCDACHELFDPQRKLKFE